MKTSSTFITGHITADPELRQTQSGKAVLSFYVAENRHYTDKGEKKVNTLFHKFEYWEKQAEHYSKYLTKGLPVTAMACDMKQKQHETKDGYKINETIFTGGDIIFHNKKEVAFTANTEDMPNFFNNNNEESFDANSQF